jgi:chromosome partitioning protein
VILSLLSLKGGVGKTTSAVHLASAFVAQEESVTLIDLDPQGSAVSWSEQVRLGVFGSPRPLPFEVVPGTLEAWPRVTTAHAVVDTPPNRPELVLEVAQRSDFVIVPVSPTGLDVDRLRNTLETLAVLPELRACILLTRFDGRRSLARSAVEALSDFPVFDTRIRNLAKYEQAFGTNPRYLSEYWDVLDEVKGML